MRNDANPTWLNSKGQCEMLMRVPFQDKKFNEGFLQELLHKHPEILPIEDIDSSFGPLIPLAREIECVDNLFISPSGRLTLVETKLWRNPEATRKVIAQIIEYASKMTSWRYEDLENKVKGSMDSALQDSKGIYDLVKKIKSGESLPGTESSFINEVIRTLERCRFLLLIVGDGIHEELEHMLEVLQKHANLHFTLALVELQLWKRKGDSGVLVVPRILAKTKEVVRMVVKVENPANAKITVECNDDEGEEGTPGYTRRTLSREDFFDEIEDDGVKKFYDKLLNCTEKLSMKHVWKSASVSLKIRDPKESGQDFTVLVLDKKGTVYTGWLPDQLRKCGYPDKISEEFYSSFHKLLPKSAFWGAESNYVDAKDLIPHYDIIIEMIKKVVDRINSEAERSG